MPLSIEDVVRKTFTRASFRGYATEEVDAFLEEVAAELTRLRTRLDETEAQAMRFVARPGTESQESDLVRRERQQLELIRRERAELVRELRHLHQQTYGRSGDVAFVLPEGTEAGSGATAREIDLRDLRPVTVALQQQIDELEGELASLRQERHAYLQQMVETARQHLELLERQQSSCMEKDAQGAT